MVGVVVSVAGLSGVAVSVVAGLVVVGFSAGLVVSVGLAGAVVESATGVLAAGAGSAG